MSLTHKTETSTEIYKGKFSEKPQQKRSDGIFTGFTFVISETPTDLSQSNRFPKVCLVCIMNLPTFATQCSK